MKLINEKGKLFGIINPVDLLIVVALILVVAAAGYKMLAKPVADVVAPEQEVSVVVRVRGAMPYLVDQLVKIEEGERLIAGNDYVNGAIKSVEVTPYVITTTTADGPIVQVTDPIKKDVLITITSKGNPDAPIFKIGNQEVRAGRGFTFKTKRVEVESIVDSVIFNG